MHCSRCEAAMAAFVDGTLPPAARARVIAHVDACEQCRGLLEELRVVDGLLLTPRPLEPLANFTGRVMADASGLPAPHVARTPTLGVIAAYLAFAWTIIGGWLLIGGGNAREALGVAGTTLAGYGGGLNELAVATTQLFGHATSAITALMGTIVVVDIVAFVALAIVYAARRPRLAERLARISESIG